MERIDDEKKHGGVHYHRNHSRMRTERRVLLGGLLMIFGGLLLLFNFSIIPYEYKQYIFTWQMIPIVIGLVSLFSNEDKTTGIILIAVGMFFYLPEFHWFSYDLKRLFWPGIFILVGFLIIFRRPFDVGKKKVIDDPGADHDYIDDLAVFGGGDRVITSKNFKGGKVTSIFGGSNFDFYNAELSSGKNVIDVFSLFGGCKFMVPGDWRVKVEVTSIFGGFSDKRKTMPSVNVDSEKILQIRGVVLFGGGEIKSF